MPHRMHFIAGLPRSGSTLLRSLLAQDPFYQTGLNSPCFAAFGHMQAAVTAAGNINHAQFEAWQKGFILEAPFTAFYNGVIGVDTNRLWTSKLAQLAVIQPGCRVICMVRPIGEIVDSYERIYQQNPVSFSRTYGDLHGNVYDRAAFLTSAHGVVGNPYQSMKEAFYGEHAERIMLVEYEAFCRTPRYALRKIVDFLGEEYREEMHDFSNVQDLTGTETFDHKAGLDGLHTLRREITYEPVDPLIPPDLFHSYEKPFWEVSNPHNVQIISYETNLGDGI